MLSRTDVFDDRLPPFTANVPVAELHLPYPPSANRLWRYYRGHPCKSQEYNTWLMEAGLTAMAQKQPKVAGAYKLSLQAARPDARKRDLDNLLKPVNDLLKSVGLIDDDHLCEMLTARWVTVGEGITVRIEPAGVE